MRILPDEIGKSMERNRIRRGMSRMMLSEISGVHINTLECYEKGKCLPGLYNLILLSDCLEISIDEYVGIRKSANKKPIEGEKQ